MNELQAFIFAGMMNLVTMRFELKTSGHITRALASSKSVLQFFSAIVLFYVVFHILRRAVLKYNIK